MRSCLIWHVVKSFHKSHRKFWTFSSAWEEREKRKEEKGTIYLNGMFKVQRGDYWALRPWRIALGTKHSSCFWWHGASSYGRKRPVISHCAEHLNEMYVGRDLRRLSIGHRIWHALKRGEFTLGSPRPIKHKRSWIFGGSSTWDRRPVTLKCK